MPYLVLASFFFTLMASNVLDNAICFAYLGLPGVDAPLSR